MPEEIDFDAILDKIGQFGRYQKTRFYAVAPPFSFICACELFILIFLLVTPDYRCKIPFNQEQSVNQSESVQLSQLNASIKLNPDKSEADHADQLKRAFKYLMLSARSLNAMHMHEDKAAHEASCTMVDPSNTNMSNKNPARISCQDGWIYDKSEFDETIVTKFDLVCETEEAKSRILTAARIGGTVGQIIFPVIIDRFGRKPALFICLTLYLVQILEIFMPSYQLLAVVVAVKSLSVSTTWNVSVLMLMEMSGSQSNLFILAFVCLFFGTSCLILAVAAWLARTWVQLLLVSSGPLVILYSYWFLLDESPRWLLATKRLKHARTVIEKIARVNGRTLDVDEMADLFEDPQERKNLEATSLLDRRKRSLAAIETVADEERKETKYGFWTLFTTQKLAIKTIMITALLAACMVVYSGMTLNLENIKGNRYLIFGLVSAVEIPACFAQLYFGKKAGRVFTVCVSMILAGVCSILNAAVPATEAGSSVQSTIPLLILIVLMKFFITLSYNTCSVLIPESFPTVIRGSGMGFAGLVASSLAIPTPYIVYGTRLHRLFPALVFGGIAIIAGTFGMFLPETVGLHLPDRIEDDVLEPGLSAFLSNLTMKQARKAGKEEN